MADSDQQERVHVALMNCGWRMLIGMLNYADTKQVLIDLQPATGSISADELRRIRAMYLTLQDADPADSEPILMAAVEAAVVSYETRATTEFATILDAGRRRRRESRRRGDV